MKTRLLPSLGLLILLLAACAPAAATDSPVEPAAQPVVAAESSATPAPSTAGPAVGSAPTEAPAPTPFPVATSRGADLHATDPGTVSLATGGLHLVEFFRFT